MTISIQTLQDVLVALLTTVGIGVAVSLALFAAGAGFRRDQARETRAWRSAAGPARHPAQPSSQADEATRDLVLR